MSQVRVQTSLSDDHLVKMVNFGESYGIFFQNWGRLVGFSGERETMGT